MKRSGKVLQFAAILLQFAASSMKVTGEAVVIDQQQVLNRVLEVLQSGSELENFIQYEFAKYASSLSTYKSQNMNHGLQPLLILVISFMLWIGSLLSPIDKPFTCM